MNLWYRTEGVCMEFTDIHSHMLFGADDGPKTETEMYQMAQAAYEDGIRTICVTPHYHPGYFGNNISAIDRAFTLLERYMAQQYPCMQLFLGNELRYSQDCVSWLEEGYCRTMNQTRYVLIDFLEVESEKTIIAGIEKILNAGYIPILAHVERYRSLGVSQHRLKELHTNGVLIQVDAQSLFGGFGLSAKWKCKAILSQKLADIVASDAHDLLKHPPALSKSYDYISRKYGSIYAENICHKNAWNLLHGNIINEEVKQHGE